MTPEAGGRRRKRKRRRGGGTKYLQGRKATALGGKVGRGGATYPWILAFLPETKFLFTSQLELGLVSMLMRGWNG